MDDIGYLLNKAARLSKLNVNEKLGEIGLTFPQFLVINHLYAGENPENEVPLKSPASIAEHLEYDRPTITGIVDRLVKQGFVFRESNAFDRRSQNIQLTQKAIELIKVMDDFFVEVNTKTLSGFQNNEILELKSSLHRIINNLGSHKKA